MDKFKVWYDSTRFTNWKFHHQWISAGDCRERSGRQSSTLDRPFNRRQQEGFVSTLLPDVRMASFHLILVLSDPWAENTSRHFHQLPLHPHCSCHLLRLLRLLHLFRHYLLRLRNPSHVTKLYNGDHDNHC
jgi:hypothetical protein